MQIRQVSIAACPDCGWPHRKPGPSALLLYGGRETWTDGVIVMRPGIRTSRWVACGRCDGIFRAESAPHLGEIPSWALESEVERGTVWLRHVGAHRETVTAVLRQAGWTGSPSDMEELLRRCPLQVDTLLLDDAHRLAQKLNDAGGAADVECVRPTPRDPRWAQWRDAPVLDAPTMNKLRQAQGRIGEPHRLELSLELWWTIGDRFRAAFWSGAPCAPLSLSERKDLEALVSALDASLETHALYKAEVKRQLGLFDESKAVLRTVADARWNARVAAIVELLDVREVRVAPYVE